MTFCNRRDSFLALCIFASLGMLLSSCSPRIATCPQVRRYSKQLKARDDSPEMKECISRYKNQDLNYKGSKYINSIGMEFVYIPSGAFMMGTKNAEGFNEECAGHATTEERRLDPRPKYEERVYTAKTELYNKFYYSGACQLPSHCVEITKSFLLAKEVVTQEQWTAVMGYNPVTRADLVGKKKPVTASLDKIREFIERLNAKERTLTYRLPTEAEWEYAGKGGGEGDLYWDDDYYYSYFPYEYPHCAKRKTRNELDEIIKKGSVVNRFGLTGLLRFQEACEDHFAADYYYISPVKDPVNRTRVYGGGYYENVTRGERNLAQRGHHYNVAFRLVKTFGLVSE